MKQNIEIKAKARSFSEQFKTAESISDTSIKILQQEDTFFNVHNGRLKLRQFDKENGELIYYKRSNSKSAKKSHYQISPTKAPETLKKTLIMALGLIGVVNKTRYLFTYGQTRIHLDKVENLGHFIEFEYVLKTNEEIQHAQNVIGELMQKLNISEDDLISHAYLDLLLSK